MIHSLRALSACSLSLPSIFSQHTWLFPHAQVLAPPWQPASATSCLKGRQHPNWCSSHRPSLSSVKHIRRDGRKWQSWKTIKHLGLGSPLSGNNIELLSADSTDRSQTSPKGLMTRIGVSPALMVQTCSRYMCIHLCQTNEWCSIRKEPWVSAAMTTHTVTVRLLSWWPQKHTCFCGSPLCSTH